MKRLAVIVPCFNEQANISYSAKKLIHILDNMITKKMISNDSFVLYVDDGSSDNTWDYIKKISKLYYSRIKAIRLFCNLGHQTALACGMFNSEFDVCITLDADLQDDINKIEEMMKLYYKGYDVVLGVKLNNYNDSFVMGQIYKIFNFMISIFNHNIVQHHADFRLCSKRSIMWLKNNINPSNLFLRGKIVNAPFKISQVKYNIKKRKYGLPKYNLIKSILLAKSGLIQAGENFFINFYLMLILYKLIISSKKNILIRFLEFIFYLT
ncbi:MAG: glycosyltransferase, partial [Candidatus Muirbacterium halophilum]|nr:glycosyltransferase [Candidatus Muirbacterium halophilum]